MSRVIPKEQLTAYQRWELGSFDPPRPVPPPAPPPPPPPPAPEDVLSVAMPTAEDLERIQQEAWKEAYEQGYAEGEKAGREAGYEAGFKTGEHHTQRLHQLAEALQVESLLQDEAIAREVLELALGVAQQILRTTLQVQPTLILGVIREALQSLPSLTGHHRIVVCPDDARLVREWLAKEHNHLSWKISEDPNISPGGFRFESAHSELDATMDTRWREIITALGSDTSWLARPDPQQS